MDILYLLIPLSVVLVFVIGFFFFRSLKGGQFEDLEGPGYRILMDNDDPVQLPAQAEGRNGDSPGIQERQI
jgi:cbb3-type cytochrome oxidase maturation protein